MFMPIIMPYAQSIKPMGNLVPSCVSDLDATIAASYTSGQVWANYEPTPADSSAQAANDWYRGGGSGSESSDPTFNGTAGSPAAYWSFDGADYFNFAGSLTSFMQSWHKTTGGIPHWFAVAFRYVPAGGGNNQTLFCSQGSTNGRNGMRYLINGTLDQIILYQQGNSSVPTTGAVGPVLSSGNDYLVVISYDPDTGDFRVWVNGTRYNTSLSRNTSTANTIVANIARRPEGNDQFLPSGTRMYGAYIGNDFIDNADEAKIRAQCELRHQRPYS